MRKLILALTCAAGLAAAPSALARTATAHGGGITARLSYTTRSESLPTATTLTILLHKQVVYRHPVVGETCGRQCSLAISASSHTAPVHVLDLAGDDTQDVVVDLYTGGAHCCTVEQVFTSAAGGTKWTRHQHDFGDPGAEIERRHSGGGYIFVSADDRFANAFTDFAGSGLPLQILAFDGAHFTDVTQDFRSRIALDAQRWLRLYFKQAALNPPWADSEGLIAAWAADEYRLGKVFYAQRFLNREAAAGHLKAALPGPRGHAFVAKLEGFLRRLGYVTYG